MKYEPNGMTVVDRLLRAHGLIARDEVWVHGMWTPDKWLRCLTARLGGRRLVRMTHGSLSPVYLERQGKWKKRLVSPIERWLFGLCDRVAVTCEAEAEWVKAWLEKVPTDSRRTASSGRPLPKIEIIDLRRFFNLNGPVSPVDAVAHRVREDGEIHPSTRRASASTGDGIHVLYLGRRHPLKGVDILERAVEELNDRCPPAFSTCSLKFSLRIVSDHAGEELERDWSWCDVLCLPTLSENFGLVVAEALARGKRVVTTDGAPAWDPSVTGTDCGGRLVYVRNFRDAPDDAARVALLSEGLGSLLRIPSDRTEPAK